MENAARNNTYIVRAVSVAVCKLSVQYSCLLGMKVPSVLIETTLSKSEWIPAMLEVSNPLLNVLSKFTME